jgi:hypothetical protein
MVYAYDQGYNALRSYGKRKSGFYRCRKRIYGALSVNRKSLCKRFTGCGCYLVQELSFLIENPEEISNISKRARAFIEKEHHYVTIAQKYVDVWSKK